MHRALVLKLFDKEATVTLLLTKAETQPFLTRAL